MNKEPVPPVSCPAYPVWLARLVLRQYPVRFAPQRLVLCLFCLHPVRQLAICLFQLAMQWLATRLTCLFPLSCRLPRRLLNQSPTLTLFCCNYTRPPLQIVVRLKPQSQFAAKPSKTVKDCVSPPVMCCYKFLPPSCLLCYSLPLNMLNCCYPQTVQQQLLASAMLQQTPYNPEPHKMPQPPTPDEQSSTLSPKNCCHILLSTPCTC